MISCKYLFAKSINGIVISVKCFINDNTDNICITTQSQHSKRKKLPVNKKSASYLGITVAEQVLSKVFKNVQVMPYGTPGYDFKCSRGFLIDVKSATFNINNNWMFNINKNIIPDYFLCIAFNNRHELTPLHLWLIPGIVINQLRSIRINPNTLNKWIDYELTDKLNDVISCCNMLKTNI